MWYGAVQYVVAWETVSVHAYVPVVFLSYGSPTSAPSGGLSYCLLCVWTVVSLVFFPWLLLYVSLPYAYHVLYSIVNGNLSLCEPCITCLSFQSAGFFSVFSLFSDSVRLSNLVCSNLCASLCWLSSFASVFVAAQLFLVFCLHICVSCLPSVVLLSFMVCFSRETQQIARMCRCDVDSRCYFYQNILTHTGSFFRHAVPSWCHAIIALLLWCGGRDLSSITIQEYS